MSCVGGSDSSTSFVEQVGCEHVLTAQQCFTQERGQGLIEASYLWGLLIRFYTNVMLLLVR